VGISHYLSLLGFMGLAGAGGSVGLAAPAAARALVGQPVGAVGPPDDRPGPGVGLASPALAIEFDHHVGAQDGVLLVAADPLVQLGRRSISGGEGARVKRHKHRVKGRAGRPPAALASGSDRPLPDRFGVPCGHPEAVAGERLAQ
jgi:hypothetical protein